MPIYTEADIAEVTPQMLLDTTLEQRHRILRDARATGPIAKGGIGPLVLRHETVVSLLHDKRLRGPGMDMARMTGIPEDSRTWRRLQSILLFMEGEDHHRLRRLVSKAFTPRAVDALRPYTRSVIAGLVDAVHAQGRCDAVAALCDPYPIPVICALVGIEPDRIDDMSRWATSVLMALRLDAGMHIAEIDRALGELDVYLDDLIDARRASPRDDLLSRLIAVEEAGDTLSRDELQAVVSLMLVAGTDTTRNQLANMIHTFARHPDALALLRTRPELTANAVEEAIRWEPATQGIPRFAMEDVDVDGLVIPQGAFVLLLSMSANHDESALPGAERFDIAREPSGGASNGGKAWQLLTFGGGIHYCLGANLARVELTEALAELSTRFAKLELTGDPVPNPPGSMIMGYRSLPIAWV